MNDRFFGSLMVVVGVFVAFAGGCFTLLGGMNGGTAIISIFTALIGIVLIAAGISAIRKVRRNGD